MIKSKKNIVGLIGLGYVGLPLLLLINKKFNVFGFDIDQKKIETLKKNKSYISDILDSEIKRIDKNKIFNLKKELKQISNCKYLIFCLPTPLKKNIPDMSYIKNAFNLIFPYLRKNQTIVLESSVYPGATEEIFIKKINSKFKIGQNFFLTYSPERIDPGKNTSFKKLSYNKITKLISGYTKNCEKKIFNFYKKFFQNIYLCKSIKVAETSKIFENIFRAVNIGLVNEMKILTNKMNINIHDVVEAAGSKPFGFKKFVPGPGVGGHCIPIDPIFMKWIAKKYRHKTKFIDLGAKVNLEVTDWIIRKISSYIENKKTKCLILGVTYKADINDIRESPSLRIMKALIKLNNCKVDFTDPFVDNIKINNKILKSIKVKNYNQYDLTILCTDHYKFNYKKILKESKKIIDTRGKFKDDRLDKIVHL